MSLQSLLSLSGVPGLQAGVTIRVSLARPIISINIKLASVTSTYANLQSVKLYKVFVSLKSHLTRLTAHSNNAKT